MISIKETISKIEDKKQLKTNEVKDKHENKRGK